MSESASVSGHNLEGRDLRFRLYNKEISGIDLNGFAGYLLISRHSEHRAWSGCEWGFGHPYSP